ncbi:hypothetical protein WA026_020938 [Henosepilachna vigintioctopunctata]|uniref:alpha-1,2-Mannosidase n=1 Tax=Henosepilachna vigintioctopunctata TaxID=420089 RepID=A0AAW1UFQ0_9CUCU
MAVYPEHVALNLPTDRTYEKRKTKSLRRQWNHLSKLQKNCIYSLTAFFCLTIFYILLNTPDDPVIKTRNEESILLKSVPNSKPYFNDREIRNGNYQERVIEHPKDADLEINVNVDDFKPNRLMEFTGPTTLRQKAVVEAFQHAWKGYKQYAWGHDHLKPITKSHHDWFGLGLTIVDSIDTIYIMGLKEEYLEARTWIDKHLQFDVNKDINVFEVTIRVLGGLLSIYHLSSDKMYIDKAVDLADRMMSCFNSNSGIPFSDINLFTRKPHSPKWSPDSSTSEATTIQLEFRDLSRITGDPKYEISASKVSEIVHNLEKTDGLVPIFINPNTGRFRFSSTITLGARGDSYYEYLLKQWLQTGKTIDYLKEDYITALQGVEQHLVRHTVPNGFLFLGELLNGGKDFKPKMDHLTCYFPGTLALGVHNGLPEHHLKLAEDLLTTCYQTYARHPTFLAPEITYFNIQGENSNDMYVKADDAHNLLRPEFVESLWYMYQLSGNSTYQNWGWRIFQGFQNYTKVLNGYTSIGNVRSATDTRPRDKMESFFWQKL